VIKEADKGNAVVILDREYYRDNILDMLKDRMYYEETDKKADQKTYKIITKLLHEHEGELHKEEIDYITNFTFTESYFYGLPKVHKSEVISNAILVQHTECIKILNPDDLKFRPIVGGPNCVTQRLSHFNVTIMLLFYMSSDLPFYPFLHNTFHHSTCPKFCLCNILDLKLQQHYLYLPLLSRSIYLILI
jgi:hypothetical protein